MRSKCFSLAICLIVGSFGINAIADEIYRTGAGDLLKLNVSQKRLFLSSDDGKSWKPTFNAQHIWKVSAKAIDKIWVGYRCGPENACVSYSVDKGQSWVDLPYDIAYQVKSLCTSKDGLGVAISQGSGASSGYLVSTDGGQTFSQEFRRPSYCD